MPRSLASRNASRSRPSRSDPSPTYTPLIGTPSRSASTTELRPAIHSASPLVRRFGREPWLLAVLEAVFWAALWALWYGRSLALGVGPLPSRPRLTRPPDPAVGFLAVLRTEPLRWLLPGIRPQPPVQSPCRSGPPSCSTSRQAPLRSGRGVLDLDAGGLDPVAD